MNHILILSLVASTAGCDFGDKCVADCETAGGNESGSSSDGNEPGESSDGDTTTAGPGTCESTATAEAFIEANRQCSSVLDCVVVEAICYQGPYRPCSSVGLSADADLDAWTEIHDDLAECGECGGPACGSALMCTDEGECQATFGTNDPCVSYERDADAFLADNQACETDADCMLAPAECYTGNSCGVVALNNSADLSDWDTLLGYLQSCTEICGADPCAATASCGPEGVCVATLS
ncbi:MAG: hypothetical protein AAGF11_24365 [Myxococcota bacterium]